MAQRFIGERQRQFLLQASDPDDYIERSLRSKLKSGHKAIVTRQWLVQTGYSIEDIKAARGRHPVWKRKKLIGSVARNARRNAENDFGDGTTKTWDRESMDEFYTLHMRGLADRELAAHFKTGIPSVNYARRKLRYASEVLTSQKKRINKSNILRLAEFSEQSLRRLLEVQEDLSHV